MMESNSEQLLALYYCLGLGVWLGVWRTLLEIVITLWGITRLRRFVLDVLFCVSGSIALFLVSLSLSGGAIRLGMLVAAAMGCVVFYSVLGRRLQRMICRIFALCRPHVHTFTQKAVCFLKKTQKNIKKGLRRAVILLYNKKRK